jgi:hypothetical protein
MKGEVVGVQRNTAGDGPAQTSGIFKEVKVYGDGSAAARAVSTGEIKAYLGASAISAAYNYTPATGSPENVALGLRAVSSYKARFPCVNTIACSQGERSAPRQTQRVIRQAQGGRDN